MINFLDNISDTGIFLIILLICLSFTAAVLIFENETKGSQERLFSACAGLCLGDVESFEINELNKPVCVCR